MKVPVHVPARSPANGALLALRAGIVTAPACGVALLAHGVGGGCLSLAGASMAVVLSWSTAVVQLGRQARLSKLLAWTIVTQAVTHLALSATCGTVVDGRESVFAHLSRTLTGRVLLLHGLIALLSACFLSRADAGLWTAHRLMRAATRLRLVWISELRPVSLSSPGSFAAQPDSDLAPVRIRATRLPVRRGPPAQLV